MTYLRRMSMLIDKAAFEQVEETLRKNGSIERFERESGKILGRMMITLGEVPENLDIDVPEHAHVFIGSFDFYNSTIGIVMNPDTKQVCSGIWTMPQKNGAEEPSRDWIDFFVATLLKSFKDDGSFGIPIYSFVNDTSDMTIIPVRP